MSTDAQKEARAIIDQFRQVAVPSERDHPVLRNGALIRTIATAFAAKNAELAGMREALALMHEDNAGLHRKLAEANKALTGARTTVPCGGHDETLHQLDVLFDRTTQGSWRTYQNGVHPVEVGGMGSGDDYAICTHGPKSFANADWIATMHDEWPGIRARLAVYSAALDEIISGDRLHGPVAGSNGQHVWHDGPYAAIARRAREQGGSDAE